MKTLAKTFSTSMTDGKGGISAKGLVLFYNTTSSNIVKPPNTGNIIVSIKFATRNYTHLPDEFTEVESRVLYMCNLLDIIIQRSINNAIRCVYHVVVYCCFMLVVY